MKKKADSGKYLAFLLILFFTNKICKITTIFPIFLQLFSPAFYLKACKCSLSPAQLTTPKHQEVSARNFFGTVRQKMSKKNNSFMHKISSRQNLPEAQKGSPTNIFRTVRQNGWPKITIPPLRIVLRCQKFPEIPKIITDDFFLGDKKFLKSLSDISSMVNHFFRIRKIGCARGFKKQ